MVHGIRLRDGRADWCRNRWVCTPALDGAPYMTERGVDLTASTAGTHVIEPGNMLHAANAYEDDGYLLTVISDLKQDASRLLVLDATGLDRIAAVHLPRRVTGGIHGSWIPNTDR
ncbi:carotenoid oxygenase family protein [Actinomadura rupiterrae]|uniref:carotenoid oxygenase family protein n=1 Tax=Actinomadura rupiterrae TaxID=559627 RepID=UPI0027E34946|nr:carotenoid oxygenase family protein [Actinomadura rupiterrae]MCP2338921.1 carotenoid cleavage dioxygenase-like enzyme [Actinomadura rupiterrae]